MIANELNPAVISDSLLNLFWILLVIVICVAILCGLIYLVFILIKNHDREKYALDFVTLLIRVPKDNETKIDAAEQMFASLHALKKDNFDSLLKNEDFFSFEIVGQHEDIAFYLSVPRRIRDLVEKQIHAIYDEADISLVDEPNIFTENGKTAFVALYLKNGNSQPLKTYKDLPTDSLNGLTSALSQFNEGEGAVIQYLIRPEGSQWQSQARQTLEKKHRRASDPDKKDFSDINDPHETQSIQSKIEKPGFRVCLRIVVNAKTKEAANIHLKNIASGYSQFESPFNKLSKQKFFSKHRFMVNFIYRYWPLIALNRQSFIANTEELASLIHLPSKEVTTHHIRFLYAKNSPAPREIPTEGLYLGHSIYRGTQRPIYMSLNDRRRHMYIIGKTGTGKSEFLKDMIMQDIENGQGVCAIDPHGEFVEDILQMIPPARAEDVIYFNPSDLDRPMGMNIMEADTEEQRHFVVSSVIGLMYKLYDPNRTGIIGPRFEHAIRNAMLTIMYKKGSTFIELVRALTDNKFVEELLPLVKDPMVRRYWTDQIAQTSDFHKSETLDYIVSKFGRFVTNKTMRNIIGQSESSFNFRQAMDEQKIILCNLSKGILGEEDAKFLGLILVPKVLTAAMSRQDIPMDQRKDFFLYVDEFQNYATEDFAAILSEARKYKLNLIVANQYIGQIEEDVKNAIFGNVGTLVSFRVGVQDASYLQHEFAPIFNETDLINVEKYHIYLKTIVDNEPVPPFSVSLLKDMKAIQAKMNPELAEMVKQLSRFKYGKNKHEIEEEISSRAEL